MSARARLPRVALALYAVVLAAATHWPNLTLPAPRGVTRFDLLLHAGAFCVLAALLIASAAFGPALSRRNIWLSAFACAAWAGVDELTQRIPGLNRTPGLDDWAMDCLGVALAAAGAALLARARAGRTGTLTPRMTHLGAEDHEQHERTHQSFFAAVRLVALLTLVSRVAGLLRDVVTARVFGDTAVGSAFSLAFLIPNVFRRLFGEGALTAAFIPEYAQLVRSDPDLADRFASLTAALLTLVTGAITLAGEAALLGALLLWDHPPDRELTILLTMLLLPYMPMVCIAATLGGKLQVHGVFSPTAASPVLLNACVIAAAIVAFVWMGMPPARAAFVVAGGVLVAGALQVAWSLHALRGRVRWTRAIAGAGAPARRMFARFGPGVVGLGTLQLNTMIDGLVAGWPVIVGPTILGLAFPLDEASNAVLSYTQRLYQFPLGVFGIAVATAVFPMLSRAAGDAPLFASMLRRGVRLSLFIGLPASAGLLLVREDLAYVVFRGGNFSAEGVERSARVLLGYAPAVWAYSLNHVLIRAFYARGDTRTPMRIALLTVAINLLGNVTLIWIPGVGEAGLAWSTCVSAIVQTLLLSRAMHRIEPGARLLDADGARGVGAIALLTGAMTACVALAMRMDAPEDDWTARVVRLSTACAVGVLSYAALAAITRRPELRWLMSRNNA